MSTGWAYLLECQPYDPVAGTTKNVFFANNLPDDATLAQTTPYFLRLRQGFSHETSVFEQNVPGGTQISSGSASINNVDGLLDYLLGYNWDGRTVTVKRGVPGASYGSFTTEFVGSSLEITADGDNLVLALRDNSYKLAKPIQPNVYAGSGGKEGGLDLQQRRKPLLLGTARNITPVPVDNSRLIFQVHDGALAWINKVYDRGVALTPYSDFANYAALQSATVPVGFFGTCLAEGFFKLGAKPAGDLTVDAAGAYSSLTNVPDLVKNLIKDKAGLTDSDLDLTLFAQAATDAPYAFEGVFISEPDLQVDEVVETLCASFNGFWFVTRAGKFAVRQFKFRTPSVSVRQEDVAALQKQASPNELYRVKTNYAKNMTVQSVDSFPLPRQTLNGFLKDSKIFVATASDGSGGSYTYQGEFKVFLNQTQINDIGQVQFRNVTGSSWLTIGTDGKFTVSDPGADTATVTLSATLGEFSVSENFTLAKSKGASPKNLVLTTDRTHFYYDNNNNASPGGQTATVTATGTNVTTPYTFTAVDNLGNSVNLTGSGTTRTLALTDLINSVLTSWVLVTVTTADGTTSTIKLIVLHGDDAYGAGILSALAAANTAITLFYQTSAPTGAATNDLWFDTDDGNRLYRYNGSVWQEVTDTRVALALTNAAGAQATADGKVTTYFTETQPTATAIGDLWYRPSTQYLSRWNGSTWPGVSSIGAVAGTNLTNSGGTLLTDSSIQNSYVTISIAGALSGAGGGQVTIGGLGYTGALNATFDGVTDTRGSNQLPSWYRSNFPMKVAREFKAASDIGLSGLGNYGVLETWVDWTDSSGGSIKQRFTSGNSTNAGQMWLRVSSSESAWAAWVRDFSGYNLPKLGGDLLDASGNVLTTSGTYGVVNGAVTIGANGALSGAGGGQVTIGGLGYTGDLNATLGGVWSVNITGRPSNLAALSGSEGIQNTLVTVGSNGALSGAGGGQVTLPGLGAGALAFLGAVGGQNMLDNSSAELGTGSWTTSGVLTVTSSTDFYHSGGKSFKIVGATTGGDYYIYQRLTTGILPSTKYTLSGWLWVASITGAATSNRSLLLYDGTVVGQDVTLTTSFPTGQWKRITVTITTSASPSFLEVRCYGINGTLYWDDIMLEMGDAPTQWTPKAGTEDNPTLGAAWSTNLTGRPTNLSGLAGSETIQNSLISISSGGALTGAGGGQVSITGLGYLGDLSATSGDNLVANTALAGGTSPWTAINNLTRVVASTGDPGNYWLASGGVNGSAYMNNSYPGLIPLPAGAGNFYVSGWVNTSINVGYWQVGFNFYDSNATYIGGLTAVLSPGSANTWVFKKDAVGPVPAKAAYISVYVQSQMNGGTTCKLALLRVATTEVDSTLGAIWSTNLTGRPTNLSSLAGSEGIQNTLISIGSGGNLLGAGGGQVTITGLGYTGSLNAGTSGVLTALGSYETIVGNSVSKIGTHGSEEGGARGQALYGSAFITSSTLQNAGSGWLHRLALGDATSYTLAGNKYLMEIQSLTAGQISITLYQSGSVIAGAGPYSVTAATRVALTYDGQQVACWIDGQIYLTTPAPAGQVLYPKVLDVYNTGTYGYSITDILYGPYPMNTTGGLSLYDRHGGTYNIVGNTVTKRVTAASVWDYNVYSRESYTGTAYVSGIIDTTDTFIGLTSNITDGNYQYLTYSIDRSSDGHYYIFHSGTVVSDLGTGYTAQTRWTITYDGANVRYYANGSVVYTASTGANLVLYVGVAAYAPGNTVSGIDFGPFSDRIWANLASRPSNLSALTGTEGIQNTLVSISSGGALSGAGGGQVQLTGLGFSGDTDAQRNSRIALDPYGNLTGIGTSPAPMVYNGSIYFSGVQLYNGIGNLGASLNSGVSIGSNGSLAGAGGGQVTIGGLGYAGSLTATAGTNLAPNPTSEEANPQGVGLNNLYTGFGYSGNKSRFWNGGGSGYSQYFVDVPMSEGEQIFFTVMCRGNSGASTRIVPFVDFLDYTGAQVISCGYWWGNYTSDGNPYPLVYTGQNWTRVGVMTVAAPAGTVRATCRVYYDNGVDGAFVDDIFAARGPNWSAGIVGRPTELTDGRVSAGLNSSGQVQAGKVITASIVDNQVTSNSVTALVSAVNNIGSTYTTICQATISTSGAAAILIDVFGKAEVTGAGLKFIPRIRIIDGASNVLQENTYGGASTVYSETVMPLKAVGTLNGTGTYYLQMATVSGSPSNMNVTAGIIQVVALMK